MHPSEYVEASAPPPELVYSSDPVNTISAYPVNTPPPAAVAEPVDGTEITNLKETIRRAEERHGLAELSSQALVELITAYKDEVNFYEQQYDHCQT